MEIQDLILTAHGLVEIQRTSVDSQPLAPHEIAGPTIASMISPGTEIQGCLLGENFPRKSGYACVIRVEQVGDQVEKVKPGDMVFCMKSHGSYHRCLDTECAVLPKNLDPQVACCARFMGVSMSTITTTSIRPPSNVLLMGLGLVGNMASRLFDCCGYKVHAVDLVASRRQQLADNSQCLLFDHTPDVQNMDLVIDCTGHEQAVLDASKTLRKGGELVLIGVPWRKRADIQAFELLHTVFL